MCNILFSHCNQCVICVTSAACFPCAIPCKAELRAFIMYFIAVRNKKSMHCGFELFTWCINLLEYESSPLEIQQYEQYSIFVAFVNFSLHFRKQKKSQAGLFRSCLWKTRPIFCVITVFWHKFSISQSVQPPSLSYFWPLLQVQFFSVFQQYFL